ncbi:MAG: glycosyltransferase family 2 protein [Anaerolineaceae bacterium]|nr:glycosyltransferase family 2 protein [Anaerolineaceae bacterium]
MTGLSVVIPVYNGALSLPELMRQLGVVLPTLADEFEVICVEDDGKDNSWEVICELAGTYPWLRGFRHMRNFGQHNALLYGIRQARYEITVTMDDDLQHPPEEIRSLLAKLDEGYDVVYGTPQHEQHGFLRDLASQVTKIAMQSAMGVDVARHVSAFRVFRTVLRNAFSGYESPFVSIDVLLTWGSTRFAAIPVRHEPRLLGTSNYTLRKLIVHALNMMTGFSTLPLQMASLMGFAMTIFGFLVLVWVIGRLLFEASIPGFPFLASIIAIFSGTQLFALGIIGEYLARMHVRVMGKPAGLIRESTEDAQVVDDVVADSSPIN